MIARLRRRHRRTLSLLAILVPVLYALALRAREPETRSPALTFGATQPSDTGAARAAEGKPWE